MAVSHVFSNTVANWTGTVTVGNSAGGTQTIEASALVRPQDWNSAHNQFYTLSGNTNNASTASGTNVVFQASRGITLAGSTGTINWMGPIYTQFAPNDNAPQNSGQLGNNSISICPVTFPYVEHDRVLHPVLFTGATNSTGTMSVTWRLGLYTKNVSTLSLASSVSYTFTFNYSGTANSSLNSGSKIISFGWTNTIEPGHYYLAMVTRTSTSSHNATLSNYIATLQGSVFSGFLGSSSNVSYQGPLGLGFYSVTSTDLPASFGFSDVAGNVANRRPQMTFLSGTV